MLRNHGERRPAASLEPAVHVHASGSTFRLAAASVPFEGSNPTPPPPCPPPKEDCIAILNSRKMSLG